MRTLTLNPAEMGRFSVPYPLCVAGERQYVLGLGAIVVATQLRLEVEVLETDEPFRLEIAGLEQEETEEMCGRWRQALAEHAVRAPEDLEGLHVVLRPGEPGKACPPEPLLSGPAVAVALACAATAHRTEQSTVSSEEIVELADALASEVAPGRLHPDRYHAQCLVCSQGGALYAGPGAEPLNVQLLLPPESMILVLPPGSHAPGAAQHWERPLLEGLRKLGGAREVLQATEEDISALFEAASGRLTDRELTVLYGLLRVHELIQDRLEKLGQSFVDHDRLAELCDEESAVMQHYFGFQPGKLLQVRDTAVQAGALGAKLTHAFGDWPALIALAPGRREEVHSVLASRFSDHAVLPVDVDPSGLRSEIQ